MPLTAIDRCGIIGSFFQICFFVGKLAGLSRAPPVCVGPRRFVSGPGALCRAQRSASGPGALCVLCWAPALCDGPRRSLSGPGPCHSVSGRRTVSSPMSDPKHFFELESQSEVIKGVHTGSLPRRFPPPRLNEPRTGAKRFCVGLRRLVSGPGALCRAPALCVSDPGALCRVLRRASAPCASGRGFNLPLAVCQRLRSLVFEVSRLQVAREK